MNTAPTVETRKPFTLSLVAFGFGIIGLAANLAVSFGYGFLYPRVIEGQPEWVEALADVGVYFALLFPGALFLQLLFREKPFAPFAERPGCPRFPFLFLPMAVGIGHFVSYFAERLFGDLMAPYSQYTDPETMYTSPAAIAIYFFSLCILPPLLEEYIYRGLLLKHLLPLGRTTAVIVSSLLFALSHISLSQTVFAFAMGVVIGVAYLRSGSMWYGVLIHLITNLISFGISYWGFAYGFYDATEQFYGILSTLLFNAAFAGIAVYTVFRIIDRNRNRAEGIPSSGGGAKWVFMNPLFYLFVFCYVALIVIYYVA